MSPPTFCETKLEVDPQGLIDEVFKVLDAMDVCFQKKVELVAYLLKYVAQVLYQQWNDESPVKKVELITELSRRLSLIGSFPWNKGGEKFKKSSNLVKGVRSGRSIVSCSLNYQSMLQLWLQILGQR